MNPNEERRRSELQNTLPLRNPFTGQKLRRKKATLSAFTLDGLWAESQHSPSWHGANPNEENESTSKREAGLSCKVLCLPLQKKFAHWAENPERKGNPFFLQLRRLWAAGRAALAGTEPTEREKDALFIIYFFFFSHSRTK
ncbi:hypothetical protein AVEN_91453-1 [Araneus ventricosus]|uniref:Uncharacterized protein n=1 Tax=Araneus ventricosus TaxID=182803 RepID=A0A4Y2N637_ARAVE|nr:hypothetical protein AVEN_91453-1 [Araneus ventricosus]